MFFFKCVIFNIGSTKIVVRNVTCHLQKCKWRLTWKDFFTICFWFIMSIIMCFSGLKVLVTPLLAGLLEAEPVREWKFDTFFQNATSLVKKLPVNVFFTHGCLCLKVYLDPDARYKLVRCFFSIFCFCNVYVTSKTRNI